MALRVAAIDFLNPAPLMWDFTHGPLDSVLRQRYDVHLTAPSACARELQEGGADLGLIPVAALTPELSIVPGCTIASLGKVRSIQLVVKGAGDLSGVQTVAADTASRSSVAYAEVLFRRMVGSKPAFRPAAADLETMLAGSDAALLIGDPALKAIERRAEIERKIGPCGWYDVAELWGTWTGLPWVAAVWACRPQAVTDAAQLVADLNGSREHGISHTEDLVAEWEPRIGLPAPVIREYLTRNIHYTLDERCIETIRVFRQIAAEESVLPELGPLRFLER